MHIVSGELRKAPHIKAGLGPNGDSTMFAVELSEMVKDFKTGEKTYTNYKAVLFAKSPGHVDYLTSTLVKGNFIVLNSEKLKINTSECGKYITLDMDNARLENSAYIEPSNQSQAPQAAPQGGFKPQAPQAPQQAPEKNVPTADDMAWVNAISSGASTIEDINDMTYRAYITTLL